MEKWFHNKVLEHIDIFQKINEDDALMENVFNVAKCISQSMENGGALYLCGNGGSAADAQHIAAEFVSRFYLERKALNAEALSVNMSSITAIGNDYEYGRVFRRQIEAKGRPGDVLIGISTSGTSENVIRALDYAKENGIFSVLMTGNKIDKNSVNYEYVINVPSGDTPRIQEGHIFIGHLLAEIVERNFVEV